MEEVIVAGDDGLDALDFRAFSRSDLDVVRFVADFLRIFVDLLERDCRLLFVGRLQHVLFFDLTLFGRTRLPCLFL